MASDKRKVLIISSTPRKGGNSHLLAESFAKGAEEAGCDVEIVTLRDKTIGFCRGCLACQEIRRCVIKDDAAEIANKVHDADVLVLATPVYYFCISGQLKTMLDRCNPLYDSDYAFRDVYLLMTAAEDDAHTFEGTIKGVEGWVECFPESKLSGTVCAGGVWAVGEVKVHKAMTQAYEMGRSL